MSVPDSAAWQAHGYDGIDASQPGCDKCGKVDATIRTSAFQYAASAVVISVRRVGSSGTFCSSCRRKQAAAYSVLTGLLGWWGFPWGPIFSVQVIARNLRGGRQDRDVNATLLRHIGETLAASGESSEAIRALEESARLRDDPEVAQLLGSVRGY